MKIANYTAAAILTGALAVAAATPSQARGDQSTAASKHVTYKHTASSKHARHKYRAAKTSERVRRTHPAGVTTAAGAGFAAGAAAANPYYGPNYYAPRPYYASGPYASGMYYEGGPFASAPLQAAAQRPVVGPKECWHATDKTRLFGYYGACAK